MNERRKAQCHYHTRTHGHGRCHGHCLATELGNSRVLAQLKKYIKSESGKNCEKTNEKLRKTPKNDKRATGALAFLCC